MNSYRESSDCKKFISQIVLLLKKIKSGKFSSDELLKCEKLTKKLQTFLDKSKNLDESDKWLAQETIEMSEYTCNRYAYNSRNDKIDI